MGANLLTMEEDGTMLIKMPKELGSFPYGSYEFKLGDEVGRRRIYCYLRYVNVEQEETSCCEESISLPSLVFYQVRKG